jgi:hypothetical protein
LYGFLPPADKELASSMEHRERRTGRRTGTAPLHRRRTSLSWRGWRTAPRMTDGDVAAGPRRRGYDGDEEGESRRWG